MLTERSIIIDSTPAPVWMSIKQAARECGVAEMTIRRWMASGLLEFTRFGRTVRVSTASVYGRRVERGAEKANGAG